MRNFALIASATLMFAQTVNVIAATKSNEPSVEAERVIDDRGLEPPVFDPITIFAGGIMGVVRGISQAAGKGAVEVIKSAVTEAAKKVASATATATAKGAAREAVRKKQAEPKGRKPQGSGGRDGPQARGVTVTGPSLDGVGGFSGSNMTGGFIIYGHIDGGGNLTDLFAVPLQEYQR